MASRSRSLAAFALAGLASPISRLLASGYSGTERQFCTCAEGDSCWPSEVQWQELNASVSGRLVASLPPASVCHEPNFDATQCEALKDAWLWPDIHESWPGGIQSPYWQNSSCDPFTPAETPCTLGHSVPYAINVTQAEDVSRGLSFARKHSLRVVIKNTGHDYMGKSSGKGALAFWTHHLRTVEVLDFKGQDYSGPAVRMGAGVRGIEAYSAAADHGLRVVGGFCPTVGLAGGYTQGGGHGPLSSTYGLGADQVLEWEVMTIAGEHIVATPSNHSDLYWALSGGGPGTYGVVLSLTVRAHLDGTVGGASLAFPTAAIDNDDFWTFFKTWQDLLPDLTAAGGTAGFAITKDAFFIAPITIPGWTEREMSEFVTPLTDHLDQLGVQYNVATTSKPTFLEHYRVYGGPLPTGPYTIHHLFGGRMIPRATVQANGTDLVKVLRQIIENTDAFLGFVAMDVRQTDSRHAVASNAVLPAWRDALLTVLVQSTWNFSAPRSDGQRRADELTNKVVPELTRLSPESGTYMNEADFQLESWKADFYGSNYPRLLAVKSKYDPEGVLYTPTGVGSDLWSVDEDGRLCRTWDDQLEETAPVGVAMWEAWARVRSHASWGNLQTRLRSSIFRLGVFLQDFAGPPSES